MGPKWRKLPKIGHAEIFIDYINFSWTEYFVLKFDPGCKIQPGHLIWSVPEHK